MIVDFYGAMLNILITQVDNIISEFILHIIFQVFFLSVIWNTHFWVLETPICVGVQLIIVFTQPNDCVRYISSSREGRLTSLYFELDNDERGIHILENFKQNFTFIYDLLHRIFRPWEIHLENKF